MAERPRSSKRRKAWRRRVGQWFVSTIGPSCLRLLGKTWRVERLTGQDAPDFGNERGYLIAFWHGRMLLGLPSHAHTRWTILVSPSADGELSMQLLRAFNFRVIRGSASRGGARALREMLKTLDAGNPVVITPDGPRGPRHSVNPGLAWMARATGYPVYPLGMAVDRAWTLNSWDRFQIPKPWARIVVWYGEPVRVPREIGEGDLERVGDDLRERIRELERRGFERLGRGPDW